MVVEFLRENCCMGIAGHAPREVRPPQRSAFGFTNSTCTSPERGFGATLPTRWLCTTALF